MLLVAMVTVDYHLGLVYVECLQGLRVGMEHLLQTLILPEETGTQLGQVAMGNHEPQPAALIVYGEYGI